MGNSVRTHGWTKEELDIVVRMANDGRTASQIAIALKTGRTRNAVIGVINRRKISLQIKRPQPPPRKPRKTVVLSIVNVRVPRSNPDPPKAVAAVEKFVAPLKRPDVEYGPTLFTETERDQCRFIIGRRGHDSIVCGEPIFKKSWCKHHYKIVYVPPERRAK
jgi:hypothetical protein